MNQNLIEVIGIKQIPRNSASQLNLDDIEGLEKLLKKKFELWSNFDSWGDISLQRLIFEKTLLVYKGKKLDICCNCCCYVYSSDNEFIDGFDNACNGLKIKLIINKLLDEIVCAEERRKNDGTYTS